MTPISRMNADLAPGRVNQRYQRHLRAILRPTWNRAHVASIPTLCYNQRNL